MGISARLYISSNWELRELITVMEHHLDLEPVAKSKGKKKADILVETKCRIEIDHNMYEFGFKIRGAEYGRQMFVHTNCQTPVGPATLLSLGSNDESIKALTTIAKVMGGFLQENDCDGNFQEYGGMLDNDDGLAFFLKNAIMTNAMNDNHDMTGLQTFMEEWNKKHERRNR